MKKRTSLKDIADEVGVSVTLVSYVLNNKGEENRVAETTAARIREVAKKLNYQPNQIARSLKSNRSQSIGLIVADISNPFFANLTRRIEDVAHARNYTVIFGSSDENIAKLRKVLDFLKARQVDGFIITPVEGCEDLLVQLQEQKMPFILIDRYFRDLPFNYVIIDNEQASKDATRYLLKRGHKKIGMVTYQSDLVHFEDRSRGYQEALKQAGIDSTTRYIRKVRYSSFEKDIERAVRDLIFEENVEALFFCTNTLAIEGLKQILKAGKTVPDDVDVVAFDQSIVYDFFRYYIPHINQPIQEIGQEAVTILIDIINGKVPKTVKVQLEAKLECEAAAKS